MFNFISLKNYYDDTFNRFTIEEDSFEEKVKNENSENLLDENNNILLQEKMSQKN